MAPYVKTLTAIAAVLLLASCGDPTKEEILKKVDGIDTKQELEKVLGLPGDISKLGPIETWTYTAANGTVSFLIAGDKVTLSATGDKKTGPAIRPVFISAIKRRARAWSHGRDLSLMHDSEKWKSVFR